MRENHLWGFQVVGYFADVPADFRPLVANQLAAVVAVRTLPCLAMGCLVDMLIGRANRSGNQIFASAFNRFDESKNAGTAADHVKRLCDQVAA